MRKIIIEERQAGERIDKFLVKEFFNNAGISRGEIIRLINDGGISVNDKKTKPSYILKSGDAVRIAEQETESIKQGALIPGPGVNFKIIFKNKDFIIIDKPAGLQVHPSSKNESDTLVNGLLEKFPEIENVGEDHLRPGIVHRLDKETSGVMVVARNQKTFDELKNKFKNREVTKRYLALVHGHFEDKEGKIEKPIARASTYKKQVIAGKKTRTKVRPAVTLYKVIRSIGDYDLVEAEPRTGRMHQIRVHLFSEGHPVVGDKKYRLKSFACPEGAKRQLLHAREIRFELDGRDHSFESGLPEDFRSFLD